MRKWRTPAETLIVHMYIIHAIIIIQQFYHAHKINCFRWIKVTIKNPSSHVLSECFTSCIWNSYFLQEIQKDKKVAEQHVKTSPSTECFSTSPSKDRQVKDFCSVGTRNIYLCSQQRAFKFKGQASCGNTNI